jgi:uncharacterized membrane protein YkoI
MENIRRVPVIVAMTLLFGFGAGAATAGDSKASPDAAEAKVSRDQAEKIALAQVPGGTVKEAELEREHGKLVWSFDIATADSRQVMDVEIDAETGAVLEVEKD